MCAERHARARIRSPGHARATISLAVPEPALLDGSMRLRAALSLSAIVLAACGSDAAPTIPIAHDAPWAKFRADARQTGRGRAHATTTGGALWTFPTATGILSSPVV